MQPAPLHPRESERLAALRASELLASPPEALLDTLTALAASICGTPLAAVTVVDEDRVWIRASAGGPCPSDMPRTAAFCAHAILGRGVFEVTDAARDARFRDSPLVADGPAIRFYAGVPVTGGAEQPLGTLCVLDRRPRRLSDEARSQLELLASAVSDTVERHVRERELFRALHAEQQRARITLQSIGDAVITTDAESRIDYLNPAAEQLTGWSLGEARGEPVSRVFDLLAEPGGDRAPHPVERCIAENRVQHAVDSSVLVARDGRELFVEDSAAPIRSDAGAVLGAVLVFHDVTRQRRMHNELRRQAQQDPLTGLVNRREFETRVERAIASASSSGAHHAVLYMDLDHFKRVNDTAGHTAGDELLRQIAEVFLANVRQRDTVARLGGDEFAVLLENCSLDVARTIAETIRSAVHDHRFTWQQESFQVGLSTGLCPVGAAARTVGDVLHAADSALYAAKEGGRNQVCVHDAHDGALARRHGDIRWVSRIQDALESDRFELLAQPIVDLRDAGAPIRRFEVLLRLRETDGRLTPPGGFLPAAQHYQRAVAIDRWVVEHALDALARHPEALQRTTMCGVNLSPQSLADRLFPAFVLRVLERTGVAPDRLCFEIPETTAIANPGDAKRLMSTLRAWGCRFALDDFGSGLSPFGYLRDLPVDVLKIDGLFVRDVADDPTDLAMVRSVNEVAHVMGKETVAEWVENEHIAAEARRIGIDLAQGFAFGRPLPLETLLVAMANAPPLPSPARSGAA